MVDHFYLIFPCTGAACWDKDVILLSILPGWGCASWLISKDSPGGIPSLTYEDDLFISLRCKQDWFFSLRNVDYVTLFNEVVQGFTHSFFTSMCLVPEEGKEKSLSKLPFGRSQWPAKKGTLGKAHLLWPPEGLHMLLRRSEKCPNALLSVSEWY